MIDPFNVTKYDRSDNELQEFLLFCILVAGKRADQTAKRLQLVLEKLSMDQTGSVYNVILHSPIDLCCGCNMMDMRKILKNAGIGCYKIKAFSIYKLWSWFYEGRDLRKCTTTELEMVHGIGHKTSRYFILHSRKDAQVAALDTHILRFLGTRGFIVPKNTPSSKKTYEKLEKEFINTVPKGRTIADWDLEIWSRSTSSVRV